MFLWDVGPYLGTNPFQGARPFLKKRELFRGPCQLLRFLFRYRTGSLAALVSATPGSGIWTRLPFDRPAAMEAIALLPNGVRPSLRTDWPMFNCCSHGTLLIFGLQSSCLNICYYHQDLHPWRLHPRPRIPRHALLLHLPGGGGRDLPVVRPPPGMGDPTWAGRRLAFTFIAPWGLVDTLWLVRALDSLVRVFKTGWVGGRPHRGPRAPLYEGLIPTLMARRGRRRTEDSPPRSTHVPGDAKCVRSVDDQCVLQFTLVIAASCVLHRHRVIWRYVSVSERFAGRWSFRGLVRCSPRAPQTPTPTAPLAVTIRGPH